MSTKLKKTFFGGYNKKSTEELMEALHAELTHTKTELSQQLHQMERVQNEFKVRLSNYEAEIDVKTKTASQLRQRIEEQEAEIQHLNRRLNERVATSMTYEGGMSRIGEIYALAYDSAYKMATEAQDGAKEFVEKIFENAIETQDEFGRFRVSVNETKTNIAQMLEQIKSQFFALQEQMSHLSDQEAAIAHTTEELERLKEKTIARISQELQQFAQRNKSYCPPVKTPAVPVEAQPAEQPAYYSKPVATPAQYAKVENTSWQDFSKAVVTEKDSTEGYYFAQAMAQRAAAEKSTADTGRYYVPQEQNDTANTPQVHDLLTLKKKSPEEANQEYTNKKSVSVKDILKKYSNL